MTRAASGPASQPSKRCGGRGWLLASPCRQPLAPGRAGGLKWPQAHGPTTREAAGSVEEQRNAARGDTGQGKAPHGQSRPGAPRQWERGWERNRGCAPVPPLLLPPPPPPPPPRREMGHRALAQRAPPRPHVTRRAPPRHANQAGRRRPMGRRPPPLYL